MDTITIMSIGFSVAFIFGVIRAYCLGKAAGIKEAEDNYGIYRREDLNPEFLKIIDDIDEKLGREKEVEEERSRFWDHIFKFYK